MIKRIFIDTETGGTEKEHALLQLAGIIVLEDELHPFETEQAEIQETFNLFVKPFPDDVVEDTALAVNHITREQIETFEEPKSIYKKFTEILSKYIDKFDKTDKFHFIAYNSPFDNRVVRTFFDKCGDKYFGSWFWTPDICVMRMAAEKLLDRRKELRDFKQGTVAEFFGIKQEGDLHDALTDIQLTIKLYEKLKQ
jgi:DNA polymerase-3 subunit epsilon